MPEQIRSFFLNGPVGKLEALLNTGERGATHAALVCHPHPLYGGTMHNKVVYHAMKTLSDDFGFPVLRFNFRGAGSSEGKHDHGRGEVQDVRAALDWLEQEFQLPILFCGFSFGAAMGLRAACGDAQVTGLISLGTPVEVMDRQYVYDWLGHCAKPKLFVSGDRDEYGSPEQVRAVVEAAAEPKDMVFVPGGDHFFAGQLPLMQQAIAGWVRRLFQPGRQEEAS